MDNSKHDASQSENPKQEQVGTKPLGYQGGETGGQTNAPTGGQTASQHPDPHAGAQKK